MPLTGILAEIAEERLAQDKKWGFPQPAFSTPEGALAVLAEEFGEIAKEVVEMGAGVRNDELATFKQHRGWLRKELIQTAAVAVAWIQQLEWENHHVR